MKDLWKRYEHWLSAHAPQLCDGLPKGATRAAIERAQKTMGLELPSDIRDSLLIHNGGRRIIGGYDLLSLENIVDQHQRMRSLFNGDDEQENDATPFVKGIWWNPQWIPVVSVDGGNLYCIDLDPNKKGTKSQLIEFMHDDGYRPLLAKSFGDFFTAFVEDLENGIYDYDAKKKAFLPPFAGLGFSYSQIDAKKGIALLNRKKNTLTLKKDVAFIAIECTEDLPKSGGATLKILQGKRTIFELPLSQDPSGSYGPRNKEFEEEYEKAVTLVIENAGDERYFVHFVQL